MAHLMELWARAAEALRPPLLESLSTWLEAHLRLPTELAAEGGRIGVWPTQKGIANALNAGIGSRRKARRLRLWPMSLLDAPASVRIWIKRDRMTRSNGRGRAAAREFVRLTA